MPSSELLQWVVLKTPCRLWAFEHGGFLDAEIKGSTVTTVHSSIPSRENSQDPACLHFSSSKLSDFSDEHSDTLKCTYLIVAPRQWKIGTIRYNLTKFTIF